MPETPLPPPAPTSMFFVSVADDLRAPSRREVVGELVLHRLHELLLAGDAEEVGVGVPVADVVERAAAGEQLVAGLEVDLRVAERRREAGVVVEVAAVDVDPDAAEPVDDLLEPPEVDRDQVVDRQADQVADRLHRPLRAAVRVGRVDLPREDRLARAVDVDDQVARERHHRDASSSPGRCGSASPCPTARACSRPRWRGGRSRSRGAIAAWPGAGGSPRNFCAAFTSSECAWIAATLSWNQR